MTKYQIYLSSSVYCEEIESVELETESEEEAAKEWLEGYTLNNAGQPDILLYQVERGEAWVFARKI